MGNGYKKTDAVSSVHYYQLCIISQPSWHHEDWLLLYSFRCMWIWIKGLFSLPYFRNFSIFLFSPISLHSWHILEISSLNILSCSTGTKIISNLDWTLSCLRSSRSMFHIGRVGLHFPEKTHISSRTVAKTKTPSQSNNGDNFHHRCV